MEHRESYNPVRARLDSFLSTVNGGKGWFHAESSKGSVAINRDEQNGTGRIDIHIRPATGKPPIKEFSVDQSGRVTILSNDGKLDFTLDDILDELEI